MKRLNKPIKNDRGFTLIEVMISLFILVLIGVTTSKAVIEAAKLKEVLKEETESSSEFRTSIGFIERDLNQVFNPRWFLPPDQKAIDPYAAPVPQQAGIAAPTFTVEEMNRKMRGQAFMPTDFWGPVFDITGIRPSRFKGTENTMSFVSASHTRIYQQKKESIYAKIRYEVIPQAVNPNLTREQAEQMKGLQTLQKIENTQAFNFDDPKDAPSINYYAILNNIKKIKFGYYKRGEKDPVHTWDSEALDSKGIFPEAVEVEVSILSPNGRTIDAKILFKLESPNDVLPTTY